MGAAFYIMAILGCGDGQFACQEARIIDARFESAAACVAATRGMLERHSDMAYPVLVARCRPGTSVMASARERPRG